MKTVEHILDLTGQINAFASDGIAATIAAIVIFMFFPKHRQLAWFIGGIALVCFIMCGVLEAAGVLAGLKS